MTWIGDNTLAIEPDMYYLALLISTGTNSSLWPTSWARCSNHIMYTHIHVVWGLQMRKLTGLFTVDKGWLRMQYLQQCYRLPFSSLYHLVQVLTVVPKHLSYLMMGGGSWPAGQLLVRSIVAWSEANSARPRNQYSYSGPPPNLIVHDPYQQQLPLPTYIQVPASQRTDWQ